MVMVMMMMVNNDFNSLTPRSFGPQAAIIIYYVQPVVWWFQAYFLLQDKDSSKAASPMSNWQIIITAATVAFGMLVIPWILFYMAIMALSTCKHQDPT